MNINVNKKFLFGLFLGIVICIAVSSTTAYAVAQLHASEVNYRSSNVSDALDTLYGRANQDVLNTVYPVGSIYISVSSANPSTFIGGEWEQIAQGRTLFGAGELNNITYTAGETIDAGLPDHAHYGYAAPHDVDNSASQGYPLKNRHVSYRTTDRGGTYYTTLQQSLASVYNPIYGNSETVQPNAYVVYMFRRTK